MKTSSRWTLAAAAVAAVGCAAPPALAAVTNHRAPWALPGPAAPGVVAETHQVQALLAKDLTPRSRRPGRGLHPAVVLVVATLAAAVLGAAGILLGLMLTQAAFPMLPLLVALLLHAIISALVGRAASPAAARWTSLAAIALGAGWFALTWHRQMQETVTDYTVLAAPLVVGLVAAAGSARARAASGRTN